MSTAVEPLANGPAERVLRECVATLQRVAAYRLPPALDRRLLWLSENKGSLTVEERDELFALVDFAEDRTVEKVEAQAALKRLGEIFPQLLRTTSP